MQIPRTRYRRAGGGRGRAAGSAKEHCILQRAEHAGPGKRVRAPRGLALKRDASRRMAGYIRARCIYHGAASGSSQIRPRRNGEIRYTPRSPGSNFARGWRSEKWRQFPRWIRRGNAFRERAARITIIRRTREIGLKRALLPQMRGEVGR